MLALCGGPRDHPHTLSILQAWLQVWLVPSPCSVEEPTCFITLSHTAIARAALQSHWVERRVGVAENTVPMAALAV